jgi:hypothetical protein
MASKNKILRLLFEFHTEYLGKIDHLSGNALRHGLSAQVNTSIGIFTELKRLFIPNSYEEFFKIRTTKIEPFQYIHSFFDYDENQRKKIYFYRVPGVTFDILNPPDDFLDYIKDRDPIQFGGGRNRGYGYVTLYDYVWIELDGIELPSKASHITLISPLLHVPHFVHKYKCRKDRVTLFNDGKAYKYEMIPPGQFFRLKEGKDVKKIALKGIMRNGVLGKFGFHEFMVHDWQDGGN